MIGDQQSRGDLKKKGTQKWLNSREIGVGTRRKNIVTKTKNRISKQSIHMFNTKTTKHQPAVSGEQ